MRRAHKAERRIKVLGCEIVCACQSSKVQQSHTCRERSSRTRQTQEEGGRQSVHRVHRRASTTARPVLVHCSEAPTSEHVSRHVRAEPTSTCAFRVPFEFPPLARSSTSSTIVLLIWVSHLASCVRVPFFTPDKIHGAFIWS